MPEQSSSRIDLTHNPAALKALTHPLRVRLLGLLRADGPATASELAATTGENSASTSYHLRVLARHGFVSEAPARDARERRWQAAHALTTWDNEALLDQPGAEVFLATTRRQQVDHLSRTLDRHEADLAAGRLDPAWRAAAHLDDYGLRLTPASAAALCREFAARSAELAARDAQHPEAVRVVVVTAALPVADDPNPTRTEDPAAAGPVQDGEEAP
ncbi:helix-turn-helix domain-containing protein [Streptomyces sp. BBFR102]|uniref:helix-turn-helix domain-containing protein n=1 Tax=Streptomyces sp. BBFR102 TaxID=3448171 RepID=UPI003F52EA5D